jgi:hypothetical protein
MCFFFDLDSNKIATLEGGGLPIHEPGLLDIVSRNVAAGRPFSALCGVLGRLSCASASVAEQYLKRVSASTIEHVGARLAALLQARLQRAPMERLDIPSYLVKAGDLVRVKNRAKSLQLVHASLAEFRREVPDFLSRLEGAIPEARVDRLPGSDDVSIPVQANLIIELCSK